MKASESMLSVVLGGGNGIGAACCRLMAERGWRVAVVDLYEKTAKVVAAEIGGYAYTVDMRNLSEVEQLASDVEREHGPVHSLVVAAGAFQDRYSPADFPMDLWRKVIAVNLEGTFNANRTFGTLMARRVWLCVIWLIATGVPWLRLRSCGNRALDVTSLQKLGAPAPPVADVARSSFRHFADVFEADAPIKRDGRFVEVVHVKRDRRRNLQQPIADRGKRSGSETAAA